MALLSVPIGSNGPSKDDDWRIAMLSVSAPSENKMVRSNWTGLVSLLDRKSLVRWKPCGKWPKVTMSSRKWGCVCVG